MAISKQLEATILTHVRKNPGCRRKSIILKVGESQSTVEKVLQELVHSGKLNRAESRNYYSYSVK